MINSASVAGRHAESVPSPIEGKVAARPLAEQTDEVVVGLR